MSQIPYQYGSAYLLQLWVREGPEADLGPYPGRIAYCYTDYRPFRCVAFAHNIRSKKPLPEARA